jgi:hypothetical protein
VQASINNNSAFQAAGIAVNASSASDTLSIISTRNGVTSAVNVTGASAMPTRMNQTSQYLTQQLAALSGTGR